MNHDYWQTQVLLIDLLRNECGGVIALKIDDDSMTVTTPLIDEDILPCVDKLCEEKELCYLFKPHTINSESNTKCGKKYQKKKRPGVLWKFMVKENF